MSGTPAWWRSKWRDEGVSMPYESWSGVRLDASSGTVVGLKNRIALSNRDRDPYGDIGAPSTRGSAGGCRRHAATTLASAVPRPRNQRREWSVTPRSIGRSERGGASLGQRGGRCIIHT